MPRTSPGGPQVAAGDGLADSAGRPLTTAIGAPTGKSELNDLLEQVIGRLNRLDATALRAKQTAHLSVVGRAAMVAEDALRLQKLLDIAAAMAKAEAARVAGARAVLYQPPQLDPADAAGAQRDTEIRARYLAMDRKQRDALHGAMARGANDTALHALLRDPLPGGPTTEIVRSLWEPRVERERADELAKLERDEEEAVRVLAGVGGIQNLLDRHYATITREPRPTQDPTYMNESAA